MTNQQLTTAAFTDATPTQRARIDELLQRTADKRPAFIPDKADHGIAHWWSKFTLQTLGIVRHINGLTTDDAAQIITSLEAIHNNRLTPVQLWRAEIAFADHFADKPRRLAFKRRQCLEITHGRTGELQCLTQPEADALLNNILPAIPITNRIKTYVPNFSIVGDITPLRPAHFSDGLDAVKPIALLSAPLPLRQGERAGDRGSVGEGSGVGTTSEAQGAGDARAFLVSTIYPLECTYLGLNPNEWHEHTPMSFRAHCGTPQTINRATLSQLEKYASCLQKEISRLTKAGGSQS